tara:strand:+ start:59 stop:2227 length:2169 start_codon:yes stop_codon:yes gene_type:complete
MAWPLLAALPLLGIAGGAMSLVGGGMGLAGGALHMGAAGLGAAGRLGAAGLGAIGRVGGGLLSAAGGGGGGGARGGQPGQQMVPAGLGTQGFSRAAQGGLPANVAGNIAGAMSGGGGGVEKMTDKPGMSGADKAMMVFMNMARSLKAIENMMRKSLGIQRAESKAQMQQMALIGQQAKSAEMEEKDTDKKKDKRKEEKKDVSLAQKWMKGIGSGWDKLKSAPSWVKTLIAGGLLWWLSKHRDQFKKIIMPVLEFFRDMADSDKGTAWDKITEFFNWEKWKARFIAFYDYFAKEKTWEDVFDKIKEDFKTKVLPILENMLIDFLNWTFDILKTFVFKKFGIGLDTSEKAAASTESLTTESDKVDEVFDSLDTDHMRTKSVIQEAQETGSIKSLNKDYQELGFLNQGKVIGAASRYRDELFNLKKIGQGRITFDPAIDELNLGKSPQLIFATKILLDGEYITLVDLKKRISEGVFDTAIDGTMSESATEALLENQKKIGELNQEIINRENRIATSKRFQKEGWDFKGIDGAATKYAKLGEYIGSEEKGQAQDLMEIDELQKEIDDLNNLSDTIKETDLVPSLDIVLPLPYTEGGALIGSYGGMYGTDMMGGQIISAPTKFEGDSILNQTNASNAAIEVNNPELAAKNALTNRGLKRSDIQLKEDIKVEGKSPSNINIYSFKYKGEEGRYEGVMAQEVPWASVVGDDGYLMVDYSKLDVEFKRLN